MMAKIEAAAACLFTWLMAAMVLAASGVFTWWACVYLIDHLGTAL